MVGSTELAPPKRGVALCLFSPFRLGCQKTDGLPNETSGVVAGIHLAEAIAEAKVLMRAGGVRYGSAAVGRRSATRVVVGHLIPWAKAHGYAQESLRDALRPCASFLWRRSAGGRVDGVERDICEGGTAVAWKGDCSGS
jgi:hypothetical protein